MSAWLTPAEWGIVALSLKVSVAAVLLTLPPSYALAWILARRRFPGVILLDALVHLPLVVPPIGPLRPNSSSSNHPVTTGGTTSGRCTSASSRITPGNRRRASTHARP